MKLNPPETAPKDGTLILGYFLDGYAIQKVRGEELCLFLSIGFFPRMFARLVAYAGNRR